MKKVSRLNSNEVFITKCPTCEQLCKVVELKDQPPRYLSAQPSEILNDPTHEMMISGMMWTFFGYLDEDVKIKESLPQRLKNVLDRILAHMKLSRDRVKKELPEEK